MPPSPTSSELSKPKSALDVVVNKLVRASVGGVPSTLCNEDLDKYVAELVLKEASAKNKLYNKEGVRAYLPHTGAPPCNLPKANKRFLFNIVKNVDDHNQALIKKTEEEAAARMRRLKRLQRRRSNDKKKRKSKRKEHKKSRWDDHHTRRHYNYTESDSGEESETDTSSSSSEEDSGPHNSKTNSQQSSSQNEKTPLISSSKSTSDCPTIIRKGRGEVSDGTKMDKYFRKDYNPINDIEPFIKQYGWLNYQEFEDSLGGMTNNDNDNVSDNVNKVEEKKKKKKSHKEKSKHKKKKHKSSSKSKKKRKRDIELNSDSDNDSGSESHKKRKKDDGEEKEEKRIIIREWDIPKLASGSWNIERFMQSASTCPW